MGAGYGDVVVWARGRRSRRTGDRTPYGVSLGRPWRRPDARGCGCQGQVCLVETGCCLVQVLGCAPRVALVAPSLVRRSVRAAGPRSARTSREDWLLQVALAAIRMYQQEIGPRLAPCCRFTPSCSHYAATALQDHGLRRGAWLAARRLLRCRPGAPGGDDPVPARSGSPARPGWPG